MWMLHTLLIIFSIRKNYTVLSGEDSKNFNVSLQVWIQFACWDYVEISHLQQPAAPSGASGRGNSFSAFHVHLVVTERLKHSGVTTLRVFSGVSEL